MLRWLIILLIMITPYMTSFAQPFESMTLEEVRTQFLLYVNQYRMEKGLEELQQRYSFVAQDHASKQATIDQYLAHSGFNERADQILALNKQADIADQALFGFYSVAENCCSFPVCSDPAKKAFEQFLSSFSHRHNLLKRWQYTAIGIDQGASGIFYFCQIFF